MELYDFHQSLNMRGYGLRKRAAPSRQRRDGHCCVVFLLAAGGSSSLRAWEWAIHRGLRHLLCSAETCLPCLPDMTEKMCHENIKTMLTGFSSWGFPGGSALKNLPAGAGDMG